MSSVNKKARLLGQAAAKTGMKKAGMKKAGMKKAGMKKAGMKKAGMKQAGMDKDTAQIGGRTMASAMRQSVVRHGVRAPSVNDTKVDARKSGAARTLRQAAEAFADETSFEALAQAIGFNPACQLTAEHGGRRLYLPERLSARHPLIKLLARRAAEALCEAFGPGWIAVPLGPNATFLQRRRRIQAMSDAGYTVVAIAETLGVHTRTVERHRAALKAEADRAAKQ